MQDKVNILVVDDRPEKLLSIEAVLEDLGQNVVRAYSGREALRHVLASDFAVILLDVNMPGMDGFETAELIRQRKSSEHIPIIFITAFGDEVHIKRGYSLGAVDYILTPVVPQVLRSKVAVFVDLFKKTDQVRRQAESLRQRAAQLHKLTGASLAINSALSTDGIIRVVTDTARELIGVRHASTIATLAQRWSQASVAASISDNTAGADFKPGVPTFYAMICQGNKSVRMSAPEFEAYRTMHDATDVPTHLPAATGWLAAPLTGRDGKNIGLIQLFDKCAGDFTGDDEAVLVQLAQMSSIALENSLFAEEREANRAKDEFLATLSHELRTPLNAILGWTQLLRMEEIKDDAAHGLDVIERNVKSQTKLIEDLLDVSRITTGKLRISVRQVDVEQVIRAAADTIRPTADAKRIEIALGCSKLPARISADPDRLQQVVWNLLSNAVKFTPDSGRVDVRVRRSEGSIEIAVIDTGRGIEPNFLHYVFDRFRQADSTSTRSHGGLGIGLTIARHIVELHGGTIRAESRGLGAGATFTVCLPMSFVESDSPPAELPPTSAPDRPAMQSTSELSGCRILVVDDERDAREVISRILSRAGASVIVAASVREAIERLSSNLDIFVSDIAMPEEDGYQLVRHVRGLPASAGGKLPMIALTAYAREEDRRLACRAGFHRHLSKPVSPLDLIAAVKELVRKNESQDRPAIAKRAEAVEM